VDAVQLPLTVSSLMPRSSARLVVSLVLAALLLAACRSPEATRGRGERGADVGNRGATVDLHGKPDPFRGTPKLGSPR
jgi:hypothetical protein